MSMRWIRLYHCVPEYELYIECNLELLIADHFNLKGSETQKALFREYLINLELGVIARFDAYDIIKVSVAADKENNECKK